VVKSYREQFLSAPRPNPFPLLPELALQALGRRVVISRKARGLSQADLAHLAGVSTRALSALERGKPTAAIGTLALVLDALHMLPELSEVLAHRRDAALTEYAVRRLAAHRR
jgi:transcriptional regulator with XRE-family HTH domain